ncbi:hypothetical protein IMZ16_06240 [Cruoricaptor ignavus]|uniref:MtN3 and saliva related transmembrane protein n=1 Tax=Cruoricaptor ignavus TaxID=1118202 RepID=A0A7M1T060_9FLAO|nr:SemiSWEET family transporter [Cruoricaptor ignavus]QOR73141.1 hypothetical protein IMZ16_06240 [Cruoricaptor ignavus]
MVINPEIIGFIAGGLSSVLFIPQIAKIIREKSAEGFSLITGIIGVVSSALWLWYGFLNGHISMIVTNALAVSATLLLFILKLIYSRRKSA